MFREILMIFAAALTVTVIMGSAPSVSPFSASGKASMQGSQLNPLPMYSYPEALPEYQSAPATQSPSNCWTQEPTQISGFESYSVNQRLIINPLSPISLSAGFSL